MNSNFHLLKKVHLEPKESQLHPYSPLSMLLTFSHLPMRYSMPALVSLPAVAAEKLLNTEQVF